MNTTQPPATRLRPVIRLFVSSTFSDMKHERNALQEHVFPKLELLCLRLGFTFQAIDLRWGVSSEAGLEHRTIRICLDEVRRAREVSPRPNFLILLGSRYGWRNLPEEISVAEFAALEQAAAQVDGTESGHSCPQADGENRRRDSTATGSGATSSEAPTERGHSCPQAPPAEAALQILRDWYRRDENALPPVHLLQSRHQKLPDNLDYTLPEHWQKAETILWAIINRAFPPEQLQDRFKPEALAQGSPPPIVNFQGSATELEIWHGALRVPDADEHVLAFFREIENIGDFPEAALLKGFVDLDPSGNLDTAISAEQVLLKDELRNRLSPANLFEFDSARLVLKKNPSDPTDQTVDVSTEHLTQLCHDVETRMTQIILEQIDEYWHQSAENSTERIARELKIEQDEHARFGRERGGSESFVGRENERQLIRDYLQNATRLPLVVHGSSGCGKTALLARAAEELETSTDNQPSTTHSEPLVRFIGVTPRSSDLRSLLTSLCQELRLRHPREGEVPTDIKALREEFQEQLRSATPEQPIILFLDALDQLSDADGGRLLNWIPLGALPEHVKIVVSCLSDRGEGDPVGQPYAELQKRNLPADHFINLDALSEAEAGRLLFDRWLPQAARTISPDQRKHIKQRLASPPCRQPIYLKLLFEEARLWPSYEPLRDLGEDVPALLTQLFVRLSLPAIHGLLLVERVLGYLAASRHGLVENEILEILFRDPEYKTALDPATGKTHHELPASATRIPIALWSRLRFDLAPYLSERSAGGASVLTFYHRQVAEWVPHYLAEASQPTWQPHPRLADYFRDLADPKNDKSWQGENLRPFSEIAFHLQGAGRWDDLCAYLTDFRCLDRRIRAGQVFEVVTDQRAAIAALPELGEEARREEERVEICKKYGEAMIIYARECAAGKKPSLPTPPDAKGIPGTGSASWEISPRADRLRAIANFTGDKATLLAVFPKDFLPLAANATADGPLNDATAPAQALGVPWLHRSPRPTTPPLRPQCLLTLQGHTSSVNSVALCPDSSRALSGSIDNTLRLWDLASGKCLESHTNSKFQLQFFTRSLGSTNVTSVALSPDGSRALSGSKDNTLRLWDLHSGQCLLTLQGHSEWVNSVAISPDCSRALSGSGDKTLRLWNLHSGECVLTLKGHTDGLTSVALSPDGFRALSGSTDKTLRLWDLHSGKCLRILHTVGLTSVAISPDCSRALSGSGDKTLRLWNLHSGECLQTLLGHTDKVNSVALSPDGSRALSGSDDNTLRLWDLHSGECVHTLQGHTYGVNSVALSPDVSRALSGSDDNTLRLWDLVSRLNLHPRDGHTNEVNCVALSQDGSLALSGSYDNTLRLWDLASGQCVRTLQGHTASVTCVDVSTDGSRALSGSGDKTLRLWDLNSGQCLRTLQGLTFPVIIVALTPDGSRALSGDKYNTFRLWDLKKGKCLRTFQGHTGRIYCVALSPDGSRVLSGGGWPDNTLRLWDLHSGQCLLPLEGHTSYVLSVAISPDGSRALSGSADKTLILWDLNLGQCLLTLQGHTDLVSSVAISPDGSRALSGSGDKTLRLWDLASGQCLATYQVEASVYSVAVSPLGDRIVCGSNDGQMHFLSLRNLPSVTLPGVAKPSSTVPEKPEPKKRWWRFW